MKLSDWASLAEVCSALAVVITLIFLILGIRDNTDVTRVSVYADLVESIGQWEREMFRDPDLARLAQAYFQGDFSGLAELDQARVRNMVQNLFRTYERAYFSQRYGVLGESEWSRFSFAMCLNLERAQAVGMDFSETEIFTSDFRNFLAESCAG